jgi:peptidoglycan/LPS O-acetylase OafA/YrhL
MTGNVENGGGRHGSRWRIAAWAVAALLLLLPLVAMQFSDEMNWGVGDFVFAGALVLGTGITYELAVRKTGSRAYRAAVAVALAAAFMLIWFNAAVGVIGSEDDPANLLYGGVLAIGIIGAILARFQPQGMARALLATPSPLLATVR